MTGLNDETHPLWLSAACAFIESTADGKSTLIHDIAKEVSVSPIRLSECFHHFLGFTPADLKKMHAAPCHDFIVPQEDMKRPRAPREADRAVV
jgi:hypothetical protein